jgi:hypothetical protein
VGASIDATKVVNEDDELPWIDEHELAIAAPRGEVWAALERYVDETLAGGRSSWFTRVLGAVPTSGFGVAARVPTRQLVLAGRHRFAQYRLIFALDDDRNRGTVLRATTLAAFPRMRGRIYRALVIGTRLHVLATRGILRLVRRRAIAQARELS